MFNSKKLILIFFFGGGGGGGEGDVIYLYLLTYNFELSILRNKISSTEDLKFNYEV